jgi:hypothetical protein
MNDDDEIASEMIEEVNRQAYGHRYAPKPKWRRNVRGKKAGVTSLFAMTLDDIVRQGPLMIIEREAKQAAREAADRTARMLLDALTEARAKLDMSNETNFMAALVIDGQIKTLRRILHDHLTIEEVRAQTRERVRRFRERRKRPVSP